jgi:tripartite-type tricarboxylate transporter receptor subunit TctC
LQYPICFNVTLGVGGQPKERAIARGNDPMLSRIFVRCLAAMLVAAGACAGSPAGAQTYPSKPIRIIVGFGAGSTADVLARIVGQRMSKTLGQQVVVENRPGAASMIAAEMVARSPNDGYTLFMATVANTINPTLAANSTFNLGRDLAPVTLVGSIPNVLVVHPSVPAKTVAELVALAKSKPDSLTFASSGSGTAGHLAGELFAQQAGAKLTHVFYTGSSQAASDLITGRVNLMFAVASTMLPLIQEGKLRALGVAQAKRTSALADVPTMGEAGMPGFDASIWIGLLAPAGTDKAIVDKLSRAVNEALTTEEVLGPMRQQGFDTLGGSPEDFARYIKSDIEKWEQVTTKAGLKK